MGGAGLTVRSGISRGHGRPAPPLGVALWSVAGPPGIPGRDVTGVDAVAPPGPVHDAPHGRAPGR